MKSKLIPFIIIAAIASLFASCKNKDLDIDSFKIERERVIPAATNVTIMGSYSFTGEVYGMKVNIGEKENLIDASSYEMQLEGMEFSVTVENLKPSTEYYYRYSINFGTNDDFLTEPQSFTTLDAVTETPTVRTLEVLAIDSTTFRVKCEVLSDGGEEVTERGVCYNTYGDPTMDDETMQYANGGLGQYTLRMEDLAMSSKYYVRAYAKNANGISLGEVLEFHTGSEILLPQVSTVEISDVTYNTAICLGNVSSNGGLELIERGVCWGLEPDPTVNVHYAVAESTTTGNFTVTIEGLAPNTTYHVRAYATNEKGTAYGEELTFMTTEGLPNVNTSAITNITATSANGGGEVTDEGASSVTERGICWGTSHNPTISGSHASSGTGSGFFTVSMTNLTAGSTYYVRAYATNAQGTSYGAEVEFSAMEGLPVVQTLEVSDITANSAKVHGNVTDQGGSPVTERGICWSNEPSPTIDGSHSSNGTGMGEYTVNLTRLTPGTKYYVRAYAKNDQGIVYGEQKDFTTEATIPTVVIVSIDGTTVSINVTDDGGATVTERGICWSTNHNPTIVDHHASVGTGTGSFTIELTDLEPGTTYYVRAYATNSVGTSYSNELNFTTMANLPSVTTGEVSNITQTSAQGSGNVTDDGGAPVTERGLCWSTSHNPTILGSHLSNGTGTGSFTVNITGLATGTTYFVRAYAINSQGTSYGDEVSFTTSQNNVSAPTVTTAQVTNIQQNSATGGGNVANDGGAPVTERGICWSTSHNPTTSGSHISNGTGIGSFTCIMNGLSAGTTYYVRAYAINSQGTSYGSEVSFTTQQTVNLPTVTTSQVSNITQTTATGGGNVTNAGGGTVTERGICWSTSHNPTTSGSHASNGGGTGTYSVNMTELTPNTTYYVRAYAINSAGTAYGAEVSFTTLQSVNPPTVTTSQVTNITQTTATGGGNVTATGGGTVTDRGICWSTSHNPIISGNHASGGAGAGTFSVNMTGLTANTTYYVRAYATNSAGTAYGSEVSFTTASIPTYTISVSANPTNGGNVTGGGTYQQGQSCTVTASAAPGYTFLMWTENGNQVSTSANYTFTVTGNRNLIAHFQPQSYTISVSASPINGGSVSGGGTFNYGQSCTVTATANNGYTFTNWTENGSQVSANSSYTFTVNSNRTLVANFTVVPQAPTGAINGLFTINANGDQVYFSQGNLQYQASSNTWRFATNQYDYIGDNNSNISQTYSGWIDLFGWGTSGYHDSSDPYNVNYYPWSTSNSIVNLDYNKYGYGPSTNMASPNLTGNSANYDWGIYNAITNGGNIAGQWRTLTGTSSGEWYYIFNTRITVSGIRFAKAEVAGVRGMILLPDNWSPDTYSLNNTNQGNAPYNSNIITATQWTTLQDAGAVFLPAAGYREYGNELVIHSVNSGGLYWSAKYANSVGAYLIRFWDSGYSPQYSGYDRSHGFSVRLVHPVQ